MTIYLSSNGSNIEENIYSLTDLENLIKETLPSLLISGPAKNRDRIKELLNPEIHENDENLRESFNHMISTVINHTFPGLVYWTIFDYAWMQCSLNDADIAELFIEKNQNINRQHPSTGETFLHNTARSSVDLYECLLNHGANPNITCNKGNTALMKFLKEDDRFFVHRNNRIRLLIPLTNVKIREAFLLALKPYKKFNKQFIEFFIFCHLDPLNNNANIEQTTLLHSLFKNPPNNYKYGNEVTQLKDLIRLFLNYYPQAINKVDAKGFTALDYLCQNFQDMPKYDKIFQILSNAGARRNVNQQVNNLSPIFIAHPNQTMPVQIIHSRDSASHLNVNAPLEEMTDVLLDFPVNSSELIEEVDQVSSPVLNGNAPNRSIASDIIQENQKISQPNSSESDDILDSFDFYFEYFGQASSSTFNGNASTPLMISDSRLELQTSPSTQPLSEGSKSKAAMNKRSTNSSSNSSRKKTNLVELYQKNSQTLSALTIENIIQVNSERKKLIKSIEFDITAKIDKKYLDTCNLHGYKLDYEPTGNTQKINLREKTIIRFQSLSSLLQNQKSAAPFTNTAVHDDSWLLTKKPINPDENVFFIMAGRKENAMIPNIEGAFCRVIIVLAELEYASLFATSSLPDSYDFLIIKNSENAHTLNQRRLHSFYAAHHLNLNYMMLLDDNIQDLVVGEVSSTTSGTSLDQAIDQIKIHLKNEPICSLATITSANMAPTDIRENELGSKFFMFNLQLFRNKITQKEYWKLLLPEDTRTWGEDYFFQIMSHVLFQHDDCHGYKILDWNNIALKRLKSNTSSFLKKGGKKAGLLKLSDTFLSDIHDLPLSDSYRMAIFIFNGLLAQNILRDAENLSKIQSAPIEQLIPEKFRGLELSSIRASYDYPPKRNTLLSSCGDFNFNRLYPSINLCLRSYQRNLRAGQIASLQAIHQYLQEIEDQPCSGPPVRVIYPNTISINLPTGYGKTKIEALLAFSVYKALKNKEHIMIICPQINLVEQMTDALLQEREYLTDIDKTDIPVIIPFSSSSKHLSWKPIALNENIMNRPSIFVVCQRTLSLMISNINESSLEKSSDLDLRAGLELIQNVRLFIADESHETLNQQSYRDLLHIKSSPANIIAFSATPPSHLLRERTFSITREEAIAQKILTPLIIDRSIFDITMENTLDLIKNHQIGLDPLFAKKGLIFVRSIKEAKDLQKNLSELEIIKDNKIPIFLLVSSEVDANEDNLDENNQDNPGNDILQSFNQARKGILISIRMARTGIDISDVTWAINMQKCDIREDDPYYEPAALRQMIGRILRLDTQNPNKVGLFITSGIYVSDVTRHGSCEELFYQPAAESLEKRPHHRRRPS